MSTSLINPLELPPFQLTSLQSQFFPPPENDSIDKPGFVKSIEANLDRIWVAGSQGKVRIYNGNKLEEIEADDRVR